MPSVVLILVAASPAIAAAPPPAGAALTAAPLNRPVPVMNATGAASQNTFNLTGFNVTVIGITSVRIDWNRSTAYTPAVKYRIFRNDAPLVDVPAASVGASGSYVDTTVRDSTTYSYRITAIGAPQTIYNLPVNGQPSNTTPGSTSGGHAIAEPAVGATGTLSITTPAIAVPTHLVASIVQGTADTVSLSWQPVPGIQSYLITRNGVQIGSFAGGIVDRNLPPGLYSYTVQSLVPETGLGGVSRPSSTVSIRIGAFNILAVGDSIMWGQGLADNHKFRVIVQNWAAAHVGRPATLFSFAHSGAISVPPPVIAGFDPQAETHGTPGEVPNSYPTVQFQAGSLAPTAINPGLIDLILVDGCINDVGIRTILDPSVSNATLGTLVQNACSGMQGVLTRLHTQYPNAMIALTGYFPIASSQSDLNMLIKLATGVGVTAGAIAGSIAPALGIPVDPLTAAIVAGIVSNDEANQFRTFAIGRSTGFDTQSALLLSNAVNNVNAASAVGTIAAFARVPFTAANSFAAPLTLLWPIPSLSQVKDEVFAQRAQQCAGIPDTITQALCTDASMGHPNVAGAQAFATAVEGQITQFLPRWTQRMASTQTAP
jgi:hypothetical protein